MKIHIKCAIIVLVVLWVIAVIYALIPPQIPISPLASPIPTAQPSKEGITSEIIPDKKPTKSFLEGKASYYSVDGCIGCSPNLTMANGERLDDTKLTVAFNRAKLGTKINITNQKTGKTVIAMVTDTGGFERHGKIVDMTIATRDAIGCGHVCDVAITW